MTARLKFSFFSPLHLPPSPLHFQFAANTLLVTHLREPGHPHLFHFHPKICFVLLLDSHFLSDRTFWPPLPLDVPCLSWSCHNQLPLERDEAGKFKDSRIFRVRVMGKLLENLTISCFNLLNSFQGSNILRAKMRG